MTVQCSYRMIECSTCRVSFFTPVVNGRTVYADRLGRPACDRCVALPLIGRPSPRDIVRFSGSGVVRPAGDVVLVPA